MYKWGKSEKGRKNKTHTSLVKDLYNDFSNVFYHRFCLFICAAALQLTEEASDVSKSFTEEFYHGINFIFAFEISIE